MRTREENRAHLKRYYEANKEKCRARQREKYKQLKSERYGTDDPTLAVDVTTQVAAQKLMRLREGKFERAVNRILQEATA